MFSEVRTHRSTSTQLGKSSTEARNGRKGLRTLDRFLAASLQLSPKHSFFFSY